MELLVLVGFVAFFWLVHAAMARIERMHPPKRACHSRADARRSPSAKPDRKAVGHSQPADQLRAVTCRTIVPGLGTDAAGLSERPA